MSKSWHGPWACNGQDTNSKCTDSDSQHLHCDGPNKGDWVEYRTHGGKQGIDQVSIHWHYEGCMIQVGEHGATLCPSLGDEVTVLQDEDNPMRRRFERARELRPQG